MAIMDEILSTVSTDAPVRDLRICVKTTAVWSEKLGLAFTFPRKPGHDHAAEVRPGRFADKSARELAQLARSDDLIDASVGVAAINSLLEPDPSSLADDHAYELIASRGAGKVVTVVGHFPFVKRLRADVDTLYVLELSPREGDLPATEADRVIPQSDVVAITGTTLINGTFDQLLELAAGRYTIVLGPSTPISPVLLEHGVAAVCGSVVTDPEAALRCVSEGVSFRYMDGLRRVVLKRN
jgi:uncharacterized protein (DUF4213/DUF364 family)